MNFILFFCNLQFFLSENTIGIQVPAKHGTCIKVDICIDMKTYIHMYIFLRNI